MCALGSMLHGVEFKSYFLGFEIHHTSCWSRDQQFVPQLKVGCLDRKFRNTEFAEVFHSFADIHLALRSVRPVVLVPFAKSLTLVIAVPKSAVEHRGELAVPFVLLLLGDSAFEHTAYSLFICFDDGIYIFGTSGATLDFEHPYSRLHHAVDKPHCLQVFGTHDILVVNLKLVTRFGISHHV